MRKTGFDSQPGRLAPLSTGDRRIALGVGLAALLIYLLTLAPTVTGEDSGELIGAAYSLGVPHPPGYPVWTFLAHLFTWLPIGAVGWRVNLLSACCAAGTVSLLTLLGIGLTRNRGAAVLGALCFAFSRVFWEHALIAEVYTFTTLFMALILYRCLRVCDEGSSTHLYTTALLAGMGTGVHSTLVLLLPFWLILLVHQSPLQLRRSLPHYLKLGVAMLLGTAVYLYLPLASLRNPAVDWGDPETLSRWWDVVRRAQFGFMVDQYPHSLPRFFGQCLTMTQFWLRDFVGLGALLGLLGFVLLGRRQRYLACYLVAMALATLLAAVYMQNFEHNREWLWVMRVFLLPAEFITAIGLIATFAWLGENNKNLRGFVVGLGVALLLASLMHNSTVNKRGDYVAEDYARNILASLPENAVYVPVADHQAFPVLYLQVAEGLRPDVTLLRKYGYLDLAAVPGLAEAGEAEWGHFPLRRHDPEILNWILENTDRPVYLFPQEATSGLEASLIPTGLLLQALRPGELPQETPLSALTWRNLLPTHPVADYSLSLIQYDWATAAARMAFSDGDETAALEHVAAAADFGHRESAILHNLGVLCARNGAYGHAASYFQEVLEQSPENDAVRSKLERAQALAAKSGA